MPRTVRAALLAALAILLALPGASLAHERRDVGAFQLVVGFATEPAIVNQPNAFSLRLTNRASGQPVEGAEQTLKLAVQFGGGAPKELPLRPRFGVPGEYVADLIPTQPGTYIFTVSGALDGAPLNERFESGPGRFNDVEAGDRLQFPEPVPHPAQLQRQLHAAEAAAARAQSLAIGGLALGLLGSAVGLTALLRRRGAPRT